MRSKDNSQVNVGIPTHSPMHEFYKEEAKSRGVKLPTHIYQLLKERYDAIERGVIWSWGPIIFQPEAPAQEQKSENGNTEIDATMVLEALGGEDD